MSAKIKNFLLKKKSILMIFLFALVGGLTPKAAHASFWAKGVQVILFFFLNVVVTGQLFLTKFVARLLNWVMSTNFISLDYTNPAGNPIIEVGLKVTQGLVNMILVLVLVYIALVTILNLERYQTRKLLITFVVIALLVNFAPVICGVVVDISNVVMNFFTSELNAEGFGNAIGSKVDTIRGEIKNAEGTTWEQASGTVGQMLVLIPFLFILSIMLLIFAFLFIFRYIMIWLLVILAPLAFAAYILPETKKYFELWWKQLIGWSFIGATAGFFIYLSLLLVSLVPNNISSPQTGETTVFDAVIPYFVSVAFLGIGFVLASKTSAMGANTVIGIAKKRHAAAYNRGKQVGKWALRKTGRTVRDRMAESETMQRTAQRLATSRRRGEGQSGVLGALTRTLDTPFYYAKRLAGKMAGANFIDQQKDEIKKQQGELKDKDKTVQLREFRSAGTAGNKAKRIAALNAIIEDGNLDDLMDTEKYGKGAITQEDIKKMYDSAKKIDSGKFIEKAAPHIVHRDNPEKIKEVVAKLKPKDYENLSASIFKDIDSDDGEKAEAAIKAVDAMVENAMGSHISKAIDKHGRVATDAIEKQINSRGNNKTERETWLSNNNPKLLKYINSQSGQGMLSIAEGKTETHQEQQERIAEEKEALLRIGKKAREERTIYSTPEEKEKAKKDALRSKQRKEKKVPKTGREGRKDKNIPNS